MTPPDSPTTVSIMGLPFHCLDHRTVLRHFLEGVRANTGGWIITPNLDILRQSTSDSESHALSMAATHRVADGLPIVWASRLAGTPLPDEGSRQRPRPEHAGGGGQSPRQGLSSRGQSRGGREGR